MSSKSINVTQEIERSSFSNVQKRIVVLCLALAISDGLNSLSVGYAIPGLSELWDVSPGSFSVVIVAAIIGEIIASVLIAPMADRFGRKALITVGIILFGASTVAAGFAPGLLALVICRFISGVGIGTASPNLFALGSEFAPGKFKATVVTVIATGMALGGAICGIIAGVLVPGFGVRSIFIVAGAIPLLVLIAVWAFLPDSLEMYAARGKTHDIARILNKIKPDGGYTASDVYAARSPEQDSLTGVRNLFRDGRRTSTILVWAMLLLSITGSYFVFSWLTTLLVLSGIAESTAIFATSVTTFGGIAGGILLGLTMDRSRLGIGALLLGILLQIGATYTLIAILAGGSTASSNTVIAVCLLLGAGIIGTGTAITAVVAQTYPPSLRATGIGWAAGFSRIGAIIAPLVGGALINKGLSPSSVLQISLIPAVLTGTMVVLFHRYGKYHVSDFAPTTHAESAPVRLEPQATSD